MQEEEVVYTNALYVTYWNEVKFIDKDNPQEAVSALTNNDRFSGDANHPESWFATAEIDGVLCAIWGNGSMTSEHTDLEIVRI